MEDLRWKPKAPDPQVEPRVVQVSADVCYPIPQTPAKILYDAWSGISKSLLDAWLITLGLKYRQ